MNSTFLPLPSRTEVGWNHSLYSSYVLFFKKFCVCAQGFHHFTVWKESCFILFIIRIIGRPSCSPFCSVLWCVWDSRELMGIDWDQSTAAWNSMLLLNERKHMGACTLQLLNNVLLLEYNCKIRHRLLNIWLEFIYPAPSKGFSIISCHGHKWKIHVFSSESLLSLSIPVSLENHVHHFSLLRTEFQSNQQRAQTISPHFRYSNKIVENRFLFSAAVVFLSS